jgi:asparagine synthase (glutamine-hydrolysing)
VARRLGFNWEFIPYSRTRCKSWYKMEERKAYYRFANQLASRPICQDWLAVQELRGRHLIPDDAVFVPGHTGDFVAGGHIPKACGEADRLEPDSFMEAMFDFHYNLWRWPRPDKELTDYLCKRIRRTVMNCRLETREDVANAFEFWDWQERQAKYICNSVRVYEFFGVAWQMPLWDYAITSFFAAVPLGLRFNRTLYKHYLRDRVFGPLGIDDVEQAGCHAFHDAQGDIRMGRYSIWDILLCSAWMIRLFGPRRDMLRSINFMGISAFNTIRQVETLLKQ